MKKKLLVVALGLSSSISLIGCSDNDNDNNHGVAVVPVPAPVFYDVKIIDGYLNGALAWLDMDDDQLADQNEPSALSGDGGVANLNVVNVDNHEQYPVFVNVIKGQTIDEDRGPVASSFMMSAAPGETVITPLSTLVHIMLRQLTDGTETAEELESITQMILTKIAQQLGISRDDVLGDFIAANNKAVSYVVENIVLGMLLPANASEFQLAMSENPIDSAFNRRLAAVSSLIKKVVDVTAENDFDSQELVFNSGDDFTLDSDADGVPDVYDSFPNDASEWVDNDDDGVGDNADTDDDNDGVLNVDDAFPLDSIESVDTDNDFIGNNADTDDDNDGVLDVDDAFPLDNTESVDTDGDGIGNNADPDDDNDGVIDELDMDPLDPTVGLSDTNKVIQFLNDSGDFYSFVSDGKNPPELYLETFNVNGAFASMQSKQRIKVDKSSVTLPSYAVAGMPLTVSGWQPTSIDYDIDFANDLMIVFPEMSFNISPVLTDLNGLNIAGNGLGWTLFEDESALYPEGAMAAEFYFKPNQDSYYLRNESPWVWAGDNGVSDGYAMTLNELITPTSAGDNPSTGVVHAVTIGDDIGVELVEDNTANFYTFDFDLIAQKIASTTWTMETLNGESFILFTVPQSTIDTWGDRWEPGSQHILFSVYEGTVNIGSLNKVNELISYDSRTYVNTVTKDAFVNAAEIPVTSCGFGDMDLGASLAIFNQSIVDCGGTQQPITADMLIDQNFYWVNGDGESRNRIFNADGTVTVYKQGVEYFIQNWIIDGEFVILSNSWGENNEESDELIWALIDNNGSEWSMKFFNTETYRDTEHQLVTKRSVWSNILDVSSADAEPDCDIKYVGEDASIADFDAQLALCGILPEMNISGSTIMRTTGSYQTRTYVFNEDYTANYYRNGIERGRQWTISDNGSLELYSYDGAELYYLMRLIDDSNGNLKYAVYDHDNKSIWSTTYQGVDLSVDILACEDLDSGWDDMSDEPLMYRSYDEFKQAITACQQSSNSMAKLSDKFIDQGITLSSGEILNPGDVSETYQLDAGGTGILSYEDIDGILALPMTWTVYEEGIIQVVIAYTDSDGLSHTAHNFLAIVDTNGIDFSVKTFSRSTEWGGLEDSALGYLWSSVLKVPDAE